MRSWMMLRVLNGGRMIVFRSQRAFLSAEAKRTPSVLVPISNGSEELETVSIVDTLVRAGAQVIVSAVPDDTGESSLTVTCSRGVKITADNSIESCIMASWDMIVLPGGMPGATNFQKSKVLMNLVHKQLKEHKKVAAICASPAVVLAHYKLIPDYRATCHPAERFRQLLGAQYVDEPVVVDRNLITSQGPGTALPFALKLVESLFDAATAERLAKEMVYGQGKK